MAAYFGSESQKRLQEQAEAAADYIAATPGACQTGRMMGCDDLDALGWERIDEALQRDGLFGFRLITADRGDELRKRLAQRGLRFDTWDVFLADRETATAAASSVLAQGLPYGLVELPVKSAPEDDFTTRIQLMMADAGVAPFSGAMLTGHLGPAVTVAIGDADGSIAAAAHGYLPHNVHSPVRGFAWGGLVAVAERHRGKGLGSYVNALMVERVFKALRPTHIYELVSASNQASRRMVSACGLRPAPEYICGVAAAAEGTRFTR
ncbi:MAG: GNAT family N-acetyltransferase [Rhizobiaceae bacterium]|nr:MAG: GNAT family N-acetyltransferase [Rhizobiaceae bacterium]CAG1013232.1 hypothetical protein RHIZO_04448 [Rhizobiaceae bacterium]